MGKAEILLSKVVSIVVLIFSGDFQPNFYFHYYLRDYLLLNLVIDRFIYILQSFFSFFV